MRYWSVLPLQLSDQCTVSPHNPNREYQRGGREIRDLHYSLITCKYIESTYWRTEQEEDNWQYRGSIYYTLKLKKWYHKFWEYATYQGINSRIIHVQYINSSCNETKSLHLQKNIKIQQNITKNKWRTVISKIFLVAISLMSIQINYHSPVFADDKGKYLLRK